MANTDFSYNSCITLLPLCTILENGQFMFGSGKDDLFLHTGLGYLRFYPGNENLILPMLSYPDCHEWALYIGCIGTHARGPQVTPMLC